VYRVTATQIAGRSTIACRCMNTYTTVVRLISVQRVWTCWYSRLLASSERLQGSRINVMIHIITWPGGCVVDYITFNRIQMIVKSTRTLGGVRMQNPNSQCSVCADRTKQGRHADAYSTCLVLGSTHRHGDRWRAAPAERHSVHIASCRFILPSCSSMCRDVEVCCTPPLCVPQVVAVDRIDRIPPCMNMYIRSHA
jgi:hypothetical protein